MKKTLKQKVDYLAGRIELIATKVEQQQEICSRLTNLVGKFIEDLGIIVKVLEKIPYIKNKMKKRGK